MKFKNLFKIKPVIVRNYNPNEIKVKCDYDFKPGVYRIEVRKK